MIDRAQHDAAVWCWYAYTHAHPLSTLLYMHRILYPLCLTAHAVGIGHVALRVHGGAGAASCRRRPRDTRRPWLRRRHFRGGTRSASHQRVARRHLSPERCGASWARDRSPGWQRGDPYDAHDSHADGAMTSYSPIRCADGVVDDTARAEDIRRRRRANGSAHRSQPAPCAARFPAGSHP